MVREAILHQNDGLLPAPLCEMVIKSISFPNSECRIFTDGIYLSSSDTRERIAEMALKPGFTGFGTIWYFRELGEVVLNLILPLCH